MAKHKKNKHKHAQAQQQLARPKIDVPDCPVCDARGGVTSYAGKGGELRFYCHRCKSEFDRHTPSLGDGNARGKGPKKPKESGPIVNHPVPGVIEYVA